MNFCTLFDSNYLTRGLALYSSLMQHCPGAKLFVLAMDKNSEDLLRKLNLSSLIVISLSEFEDQELLAIKSGRGRGEYCWTCTPSLILYTMQRFSLENATYVDSDVFFFSNPTVLIEEMKGQSILLTEHRYTPGHDMTDLSGRYCVQFMTFKNTEQGMKALEWWRARCLEWCFNRHESGKFGDQKYLDDWLTRFEGCHVLQHLGGGVAPWNVQQYRIHTQGKDVFVNKSELVFYHFHQLKTQSNGWIDFGDYDLSSSVRCLIYKPYLQSLDLWSKKLGAQVPKYDLEMSRLVISQLIKKWGRIALGKARLYPEWMFKGQL